LSSFSPARGRRVTRLVLADRAAARDGQVDQVVVHDRVHAGAALAVGGVAVAVPAEQHPGGQVTRQRLGPPVGRGGVAQRADDQDGRRACGPDPRQRVRGDRPVGTGQAGPDQSATCRSPRWLASGTELARAIRAWTWAAAAATELPGRNGQPPDARHQAANDPNATWKPCACAIVACSEDVSGSTAPSRTSARTRCGNNCAYHAPRYVPYDFPK
jgi:hypothetical protein